MAESLKYGRIGSEFFRPAAGSPTRDVDDQGNIRWALDSTNSEEICSQPFEWPSFAGTPTLAIWGNFAATSGNIGWSVSVESVASGDSLDVTSAASFDTANSPGAAAVPGTAGHTLRYLVPLSNRDGAVAGERVRLKIASDNSVSSKATGDRYFEFAALVDVT